MFQMACKLVMHDAFFVILCYALSCNFKQMINIEMMIGKNELCLCPLHKQNEPQSSKYKIYRSDQTMYHWYELVNNTH